MPPDPVAPKPPRQEIPVSDEHAGERLDRFIASAMPDLSRAHAQRMIEDGAVAVNDRPAKPSAKLKPGDVVSLTTVPAPELRLIATPLALSIVYEDEDVLVIDKPAGLVVHPAPGHAADTLVNALVSRYPSLRIGSELRPGIVHRLDKDTSGLMVVAKNDRAMASLVRQMKQHGVLKEYLALVDGHPPARMGVVEAPVGRHPTQRQRMAIVPGGREARSHFALVETIGNHSLLRVRLETGRTHQIRVHLASLGLPVEGDRVYGRRDGHCPGLGRQFLHAVRLGFNLPSNDERVELASALPADLQACLETLREGQRA